MALAAAPVWPGIEPGCRPASPKPPDGNLSPLAWDVGGAGDAEQADESRYTGDDLVAADDELLVAASSAAEPVGAGYSTCISHANDAKTEASNSAAPGMPAEPVSTAAASGTPMQPRLLPAKRLTVTTTGRQLVPSPCDARPHAELDELLEELRTQVRAFLTQLPNGEQHQVLDRLLRRLAEGQPLSARRASDQVDESCEFLAELLGFCGDLGAVEAVLRTARASVDANAADEVLTDFLSSRRRYRLSEQRVVGAWEEHFTVSGERYFYNNSTQKTQWAPPDEWPKTDDGYQMLMSDRRSLAAPVAATSVP